MPDNNALHDAAGSGNLAEVQAQVNKFDINAKGKYDETALVKAAENGHTDVVKLFLTVDGIDVNIPNVSALKMTYIHLISISLNHRVYFIPYRHDCFHSCPTNFLHNRVPPSSFNSWFNIISSLYNYISTPSTHTQTHIPFDHPVYTHSYTYTHTMWLTHTHHLRSFVPFYSKNTTTHPPYTTISIPNSPSSPTLPTNPPPHHPYTYTTLPCIYMHTPTHPLHSLYTLILPHTYSPSDHGTHPYITLSPTPSLLPSSYVVVGGEC